MIFLSSAASNSGSFFWMHVIRDEDHFKLPGRPLERRFLVSGPVRCVWVTNLVTQGGSQHRSHREELALPLEAYSPLAWWSTMYVNRSGHEVGNSYKVSCMSS